MKFGVIFNIVFFNDLWPLNSQFNKKSVSTITTIYLLFSVSVIKNGFSIRLKKTTQKSWNDFSKVSTRMNLYTVIKPLYSKTPTPLPTPSIRKSVVEVQK